MTIDLTPEELKAAIRALDRDTRAMLIAEKTWAPTSAIWAREFRGDADRCAALSKRLGELAEEVGR